jgi:hypothetical protein
VLNIASASAPPGYPAVEVCLQCALRYRITDIVSRIQFVVNSGSPAQPKKAGSLSTAKNVDKKDQLKRAQFQMQMHTQQELFQDESQHHVAGHGREFIEHGAQSHESSELGSTIMPIVII